MNYPMLDDEYIPPTTTDDALLKRLTDEIVEFRATISKHDENLTNVMELLAALNEQVAPAIAGLSNGPLGKMIGL